MAIMAAMETAAGTVASRAASMQEKDARVCCQRVMYVVVRLRKAGRAFAVTLGGVKVAELIVSQTKKLLL